MNRTPDDDEYVDLLESMVAMADDARHEANVSIARGEKVAAVALQYANRIQDIEQFAQLHFPSEWRIRADG